MYFNSHAHIASYFRRYGSSYEIVKKAIESGVTKIVDSGINNNSCKNVLEFQLKFPGNIIPTTGLHPEILIPDSEIYENDFNIAVESIKLKKTIKKNLNRVKAVGECGLDWYWIDRNKKLTSSQIKMIKEHQVKLFLLHIEIALEFGLPIVVHSRGAEEECLKIISKCLKRKNKIINVMFHSFTGPINIALEIFENGYFISFNGIITYKSGEEVGDIFKIGWKKYRRQILSETDSPYLIPSNRNNSKYHSFNYSSKVCYPGDVIYVVKKMSELLGEKEKKVASVTYENAMNFYKLEV